MNIRIPLKFVAVDDAFAWLLNDESRKALQTAAETGAVDKAEVDAILDSDRQAREMPGAFIGHAVFDPATMGTATMVSAEATRRARAQADAERERATKAMTAPRFALTPELVNLTVQAIRPELTFLHMEGDGAELYPTWDSIPEAVKNILPGALEPHYMLGNDIAAVLKKKPAKSQGKKARA